MADKRGWVPGIHPVWVSDVQRSRLVPQQAVVLHKGHLCAGFALAGLVQYHRDGGPPWLHQAHSDGLTCIDLGEESADAIYIMTCVKLHSLAKGGGALGLSVRLLKWGEGGGGPSVLLCDV